MRCCMTGRNVGKGACVWVSAMRELCFFVYSKYNLTLSRLWVVVRSYFTIFSTHFTLRNLIISPAPLCHKEGLHGRSKLGQGSSPRTHKSHSTDAIQSISARTIKVLVSLFLCHLDLRCLVGLLISYQLAQLVISIIGIYSSVNVVQPPNYLLISRPH